MSVLMKKGVKRNQMKKTLKLKEHTTKKSSKSKDDEIQSLSGSESETGYRSFSEHDSEEDYESAHEKRVRLTKKLLVEAQKEAEENEDIPDLGLRLREEALELQGKANKEIALKYGPPDELEDELLTLKGHKQPVTCIVISNDSKYIYSAAKDSTIIKWNAMDGKKVKVIPGGRKNTKHPYHTSHILSIAISTDNKFLATGDAENKIYVWNPETMEKLNILTRHKGPVTSLKFRQQSHQLFSGCEDGNIYVWNLDIMALLEDLVGHKSSITSLDSLSRDRCISCSGGCDVSVHIWKIPEQSNLEFRIKNAVEHSLDCIALINEEKFITGSSTNRLYLWTINRASPVHCISHAHLATGPAPSSFPSDAPAITSSWYNDCEMWISSVAALHCTDLVASGASDGHVRLWRVAGLQDAKPRLEPLFTVSVTGFVNSLEFSPDGSYLVAGVGQEHRRGRWLPRIKEARNCIKIIKFKRQT